MTDFGNIYRAWQDVLNEGVATTKFTTMVDEMPNAKWFKRMEDAAKYLNGSVVFFTTGPWVDSSGEVVFAQNYELTVRGSQYTLNMAGTKEKVKPYTGKPMGFNISAEFTVPQDAQ